MAVALLMSVAACSSDKKASTSSASSSAALTASFRGVTVDEIKIGVATVDFKCLTDQHFVDFNQGDTAEDHQRADRRHQQQRRRARPQAWCRLQGDLPARRQRHVRRVHVVHRRRAGVRGHRRLRHAAVGRRNQLCLTQDQETILIDELTTKDDVDGATPGLLLTPRHPPERRLDGTAGAHAAAEDARRQEGRAARRPEQPGSRRRRPSATAAETSMGIETGLDRRAHDHRRGHHRRRRRSSTASSRSGRARGSTPSSCRACSSRPSSSSRRSARRCPTCSLITDDSGVGEQAVDEAEGRFVTPNPYEGMLSLAGLNDQETFETAAPCRTAPRRYEDATGETVVAPKDIVPGADGKSVEHLRGLAGPLQRARRMLKLIAEKAGRRPHQRLVDRRRQQLRRDRAADQPDRRRSHEGKYDADDGFRLADVGLDHPAERRLQADHRDRRRHEVAARRSWRHSGPHLTPSRRAERRLALGSSVSALLRATAPLVGAQVRGDHERVGAHVARARLRRSRCPASRQ